MLVGFVLGAVRFVFEVLDKSHHFDSAFLRWLVDMNFLHYAILMFAICTVVLTVVSLVTPAPSLEKVAGLTFATVDMKLETSEVAGAGRKISMADETQREHRLNVAFSLLLLGTVVGLWIYFR